VNFKDLALVDPLLRALQAAGYARPTPIQAQSIPPLLAGRDVCGTAQTGTGKTAAFALPILQKCAAAGRRAGVRALVLAPSRELVVQIAAAFGTYGQHLPNVRHAAVYGGMDEGELRRGLSGGVDVLVATPGRLLDLVGHKVVSLDHVEMFVLDEADRMLDLGFLPSVLQIAEMLPKKRQTALYSSTLPAPIEALSEQLLTRPARVAVANAAVADGIEQRVYFVEPADKRPKLVELFADPAIRSAMIFTRTRHGVERINSHLIKAGIRSAAIHGDKPQHERLRVLSLFGTGMTRVLVATDVAARGLDIDGITHVINYDLPNVPESYVNRIGRTARAGARGVAISLCASNELELLAGIERFTKVKVARVGDWPAPAPAAGGRVERAGPGPQRPDSGVLQRRPPPGAIGGIGRVKKR
jgi:ATP-dependent RNA helicase RhlE